MEVREKLAFDDDGCSAALRAFREQFPNAETVILSTCNRTEIYLTRPLREPPRLPEAVEFLAHRQNLDSSEFAPSLYFYEDSEAVRHLFRVVASLDSMVLGESQILGQAKHALRLAQECNSVGPAMTALFQRAFGVAKRIHTETQLAEGHVSIGSAALDFARQIFTRFDDKVVLMVGAGKMGELTLKHLMDHHPKRVLVTNRTAERASALAKRIGAEARPFENLADSLAEADIVLTSTGSPEPVITLERCGDLPRHRKYRPLLVIDLAVPRDVEDAVGELENVFVYDIDDLQRITEQHWEERRSRADVGQRMVEESVREFLQERARRDVGPVVAQLRDHLKGLADSELEWLTPKLKAASEQDRKLVAQLLHRVVNKILHQPTQALNEKGQEGLGQVYAEVIRRLFDLEEDE